MKAERVVCDTNVLISAAIVPHGTPRRVVEFVRANGQLLLSREAMAEFATRISRSKFDKYLSSEARQAFLDAVASVAELVEITGLLKVCRDADDDKILETAIAGRADCLVTGDGDLLALRLCGEAGRALRQEDARYGDLSIVRPAEFMALID